jgi:hypothetical protein
LARSAVQLGGDEVKVFGTVLAEVGALREVLPK